MNTNETQVLNDPKTINGWAFFDWANSAFALTIAVAIFPNYYEAITEGQVYRIFGIDLTNTALYSFALSAAYLVVSVLSPYLSGIADYGGKKMQFMKFFTFMGSISCLLLFFFQTASDVGIGITFFVLGTIGFAGSLVFYNSYLPDIATEDQYDRVSAKGFAYGYIGSVILLVINLLIITFPEKLGFKPDSTIPARLAFVSVGLWWMGFAMIPFNRLPKDTKGKLPEGAMSKSIEKLKGIARQVLEQKNIKRFLIAFFCYSAGVQTLILLASLFGTTELGFETSDLIVLILLLQLLAIGGAYLFAFVSERFGNKLSLLIMLAIWVTICVVAYFVSETWQFYAIAAGVGLVMGGIQSLSRSTYSKLLPQDTTDTTSYFSFYDILEKYAVVLGTLLFGIVDQMFGMRNSVLFLAVFFLAGMLVLTTVKIQSAKMSE